MHVNLKFLFFDWEMNKAEFLFFYFREFYISYQIIIDTYKKTAGFECTSMAVPVFQVDRLHV